MTGNIVGSPRTTTAGALGVVFAAIGSQIIPALAAYFGAQPGIVWQLLGMALGAIPGAFMSDLAKKVSAAIDPPKPPIAPVALALLVGGSLLFAAPARAQEIQPAPAAAPLFQPFYLDSAHAWSVTPLAGVSGTLYDLAHSSAARSFQFALGAELKRVNIPVGFALSGAFQAGDVIGGSAVGAITLPSLFDTGVGFSYMFAGTAKSYGPVVVKVVRF